MTIILEHGEKLLNKDYMNMNQQIICKGDNLIENCMFAKVRDFDILIKIEGHNCIIKNNRFQEITEGKTLIKVMNGINKTKIINNLFMSCKNKESSCIDLQGAYTILSRNRIENITYKHIINIGANSYKNIIVNNEIINCIGNVYVFGKANIIAINKIDYKEQKKSQFLDIRSFNNTIQSNEIKNCDKAILFNNDKLNNIKNNVFSKCNVVYQLSSDFSSQAVNQNIILLKNNYVSCKKISNKNIDTIITKSYNNVIDTNYDFIFDLNVIEEEDYDTLLTKINEITIKYEEEKKVEESNKVINGNCCQCKDIIKAIKIKEVLAEYRQTNNKMRELIVKLGDLLKE